MKNKPATTVSSVVIKHTLSLTSFRNRLQLFIIFILIINGLLVNDTFAQSTSIWSNIITGTNLNTFNPYTGGQVVNANITASGIGRGSSLTGYNVNDAYNALNWPTDSVSVDANGYFNFIITPATGFRYSLSGFVYTGTSFFGPQSFALRSDVAGDNFSTNIGSAAASATVNLASANYQSINRATEFRLYGYRSYFSIGAYYISDFVFNGSVLGSATTSLTGLGYVYGAATSTVQSFIVKGNGLTTSNAAVTISGSANYEVSTTSSGTGFGTSATLTANGGNINGTIGSTVWVRLRSGRAAGTYTEGIGISGGGVGGIAISCSGTVSTKPLTMTGVTVANKVYDGLTTATVNTGAASLSGVISGDAANLAINGTNATGQFSSETVGTGKTVTISGITLSGTAAGNYTLTQPSATANITARPLTVTVIGTDKIYDGTTTATVGLSDNRISGDVLTTTKTSAVFADKNVGTAKTINVSGISISGTDAANYTVNTSAVTTANITAKSLTITSVTGINKVYDGLTTAVINTGSAVLAGVIAADASNVTLNKAAATGTFADKNKGTSKTVATSGFTLSGSASGNYSVIQPSTSASITARTLAVSATGIDKVYDGTTTATVNLADNRISGDVLAGVYSSATFSSKTVGTGKTVSIAGISISGTDAANYAPNTTSTTTANITAKEIPVTGVTGTNKLYDGLTTATISTTSAALAGVVAADVATVTLNKASASGSFTDKNIGTGKTIITAGFSISGTSATNYSLTQPATTANITPRSLTILATGINKPYDGNTTATVTLSDNRISGDVLIAAYASASFTDKNAGTGKTVNVAGISISGTNASNYTVNTTATTSANITAKTLTVTAACVNKTYDGNTTAMVTLSDNPISGDILTAAYTTASFADKNVGTGKTVSVTGISISGTSAANYTSNTMATTTANITGRSLIVSATGINKVYDGNTSATISLSDNRISGDILTAAYTTASFADKNVGTGKTVSVAGISISGTNAANYTVNTTATTAANISRASLTITAGNQSKCEGHLFTFVGSEFTPNGLLANDVISNIGLTSTGASVLATTQGSPYTIVAANATGTGLENYTITYVNGILLVKAVSHSSATVTSCNSYSWNGSVYTQSGVYSYTSSNSNGCDSVATLHLTINHNSTSTAFNASACNSYELPWGSAATTSGNYTHTYTNAAGCDSVVTAHITINHSTASEFSIASCNSYDLPWGDRVSSSGDYIHTYLNANGCDSVVTAHVTISLFTADDLIVGPTDVCAYMGPTGNTAAYSITSTGGTGYVWTVPNLATIMTGQGTNTITVKYDTSFVSGNISVTVTNTTCGGSLTRNMAISESIPAVPGPLTGPLDACPFITAGSEATYTVPAVDHAISYEWTLPPLVHYIRGEGTTSITVKFDSGYVAAPFFVRAVSGCGSSTDTALMVINIAPLAPGPINGPTNACIYIGTNTAVTYTINKVPLTTSYIWTMPQGATIVSHPGGWGINDTIIKVVFDNSFVTSTRISVKSASICGTSSVKNLLIYRTITTLPGMINGPTNACPLMQSATNPTGTQVSYSVNRVLTATSYTWTVPAGATINGHPGGSGVNDTIILITYGTNFTGGSITVAATNGCGTSAARTLTITKPVLTAPGTITGPTNACALQQSASNSNGTSVTYSIRKLVNATGYVWTVPAGVNIVSHPGGSGENDTVISVTFSNGFTNGSIMVLANNNCTGSTTRSLAITRIIPAMPGTIIGPTNPCMWIGTTGATYTIRKVANATGYTWKVPSTGATILSHPAGPGVNDTIITVQFTNAFTTGAITVTADVNCGSSAAKSLVLTRLLPVMPGAITGPVNSCEWIGTTATYTIKKVVNATAYNWNISTPGATITAHPGGREANDTIVTVSYTNAFSGGNISVSATNNCVSSAVKNLAITRTLPASPGAITSTVISTCPARRYSYSIAVMPANATTVLWAVPPGATITGGQGTLSITVDYPQGQVNDTVKVSGVNSCANGVAKKLKVTLAACTVSQPGAINTTTAASGKAVMLTNATQQYACNDMSIINQADSMKRAFSTAGYILIKEAGMSMENDIELPVEVTLSSNAMYQFVFIGDGSSASYTLRMFDSEEKEMLFEKKIFSNPDGNMISYGYRAQFPGYHIIRPSQVNEMKKNYCGYIMVFKKTE